MDIHRCRFVPFQPAAINAIAFSHNPSTSDSRVPKTLRLAIGRANGDIEIWDPLDGRWFQETILRGGKDRSIEGLTWTQDLEGETPNGNKTAGRLRLFSIGYSAVITEWDLALGKPARHSDGNYGDIWCIAAQPRWKEFQSSQKGDDIGQKLDQNLAVGCADGTLVLYSTSDGDLTYLRTLQRPSSRKARVLSLAFQSRQRIVAGFSDSTIRIFDTRGHGRVISNMSLGAGSKKGPSEIFVWVVKCLSDGTIISGDSTGEVKIWDPATSSLMQRIQGHSSDVLTISPSADGLSMMSGGLDRRTVNYKRTNMSKRKGRWTEISHQRLHSNDVKAMASFEARNMKVIASGGLDATPIIIPMDRMGQEYTRSLPTMPNLPPLQSSPEKRFLMSWWDREVNIWRVDALRARANEADDTLDAPLSRQLIAKIMLQGEENINAASLSRNGSLLVVSTISDVKLFTLRPHRSSKGLKVQRVNAAALLPGHGARLVEFSPDSQWLVEIRLDSSVYVHQLREEQSSMFITCHVVSSTKLSRLARSSVVGKQSEGSLGAYTHSLSRVAWSGDSRILVVCDLAGCFDAWMLGGREHILQNDTVPNGNQHSSSETSSDEADQEEEGAQAVSSGQRWTRVQTTLPKAPSAPLVMSFRPQQVPSYNRNIHGDIDVHPEGKALHPQIQDQLSGEDRLLVVTANHQLLEYHVTRGQLSQWSRRNPSGLLPQEFKDIRERVMGCIWDVSESDNGSKDRIWLYGSTWLWMFDLSRDLPSGEHEPIETGASEYTMAPSLITTETSKKRTHEAMTSSDFDEERRLSKLNTAGAGGKVPMNARTTGIGTGMLTHESGGQKLWTSFEPEKAISRLAKVLTPTGQGGANNDDGENESSDSEVLDVHDDNHKLGSNRGGSLRDLVRLRREENKANKERDNSPQAMSLINGHAGASDLDGNPNLDTADDIDANGDASVAVKGPRHWRTYKYRPILGIVSLGGGDGDVGAEVALVERPLWDTDAAA